MTPTAMVLLGWIGFGGSHLILRSRQMVRLTGAVGTLRSPKKALPAPKRGGQNAFQPGSAGGT